MNTAIITATSSNVSVSSQTLEACLKSASHFTGTTIYNICAGTQYYVPNGFWDYALGFFLLAIGLAFVSMLFAMAAIIID